MLGTAPENTINIGLIAKDNSHKQTIGKSNFSFGYYRGDLFLSKRKVKNDPIRLLHWLPQISSKKGISSELESTVIEMSSLWSEMAR